MTEAVAFVPGHVTGFFSAHQDDDPTKAGSRGAGVALADGVTVRLEPGDGVELNGEACDLEAVDRVLEALRSTARVVVETDLPLSAGFGVSGAAALGTALTANAVFDHGLSENELVTVAHGAMDGIPATRDVEYLTLGELSTADVLAGDTAELNEAGRRALSALVAEPTLETFMHVSRRFAREADLLTPEVQAVIEDVSGAGEEASMAMLGETVFALDAGLSDAGYDAERCSVSLAGAHLQ